MEINKQAKYEGYIWYSDQAHPQILRGKEFDLDQLKEYINPFVIEGQLWDAEHGISVSIRNVDGKYIVHCHQVAPRDLLGTATVNAEQYIPHRIEGVGRLCFLRYWKAVKDELCEDFKTLRPEKLVFVGFENLTNKED